MADITKYLYPVLGGIGLGFISVMIEPMIWKSLNIERPAIFQTFPITPILGTLAYGYYTNNMVDGLVLGGAMFGGIYLFGMSTALALGGIFGGFMGATKSV